MDGLTHSLVGLTSAKAGLERWSPYATVVCILSANAPDSDVISGFFGGRWTLLHYHRGITHSIIGTLALGLLIPSIFYAVNRAIAKWRKRPPQIRYRGLLMASLIAAATHPLMDWTNHYGVLAIWILGLLAFILARCFSLQRRLGKSIAFAALAFVVCYWGALALMHHAAYENAFARASQLAAENGEQLVRVAAMPTAANPLR